MGAEPTNPLAERLDRIIAYASQHNVSTKARLRALMLGIYGEAKEAKAALTAQEAAPPQPTREQIRHVIQSAADNGHEASWADDAAIAIQRLYAAPSEAIHTEGGRMSNDGGPAFPSLSIRDWFAGQALAGMVGNETITRQYEDFPYLRAHAEVAECAFELADAMIAARAPVETITIRSGQCQTG